jgi:hypothetical protein
MRSRSRLITKIGLALPLSHSPLNGKSVYKGLGLHSHDRGKAMTNMKTCALRVDQRVLYRDEGSYEYRSDGRNLQESRPGLDEGDEENSWNNS